MIEKLNFVNMRNQTLQMNTATMPLENFHADGETRATDRPKMQTHGSWKGFAYLGFVVWHAEGHLLADTTEDYITARLNIMDILIPPPGKQRDRKWGTLYVRYTGMTEDLKNDCYHEGYPELPMEALFPSVTPFMFSFHCFDPFWTGVGTGRRITI